jgi:hypothetical protein
MNIATIKDVAGVVRDTQSWENIVDMRISMEDLASNKENADIIPDMTPHSIPVILDNFISSLGKM